VTAVEPTFDDRIPVILQRVDLVALVERYAGPGRQSAGTTTFRCPNPAHADHHPSFSVKSGRWRCWSQCGTSGDAIDLLVWLGKAGSKAEAIELLGAEVGVGRRDEPRSACTRPLSESGQRQIVARYLEQRGWPVQLADELGLTVVADQYGYRRIRHPFRLRGEVVGWQDRAVDANARLRWLSSQGPIRCPYEADRLRRAVEVGEVLVVEGVSDLCAVVAAFTAPAVVGIPGAWGFKPEWAAAFHGLDAYLATDNDAAGAQLRKTIWQALWGVARSVRVVWIPEQYKDIAAWQLATGDLERFAVELEAACAIAEGWER
jgi:DNA primase